MAQLTPPKTMAFLNDPWLSPMIAPPIGEPVNAAIAAIEKTVPERMPISWMGETCAQRAGVRPIPAPEAIPKNAAKTIRAALPVAGSHNARMRMVVKAYCISPGQHYAFKGSTRVPRTFFGALDWVEQRYTGLGKYEHSLQS